MADIIFIINMLQSSQIKDSLRIQLLLKLKGSGSLKKKSSSQLAKQKMMKLKKAIDLGFDDDEGERPRK